MLQMDVYKRIWPTRAFKRQTKMRLDVICLTYANHAACNQGSGITPIHL